MALPFASHTSASKRMKKVLTTISRFTYGLVVLAVVAMALLFIGTKIDLFGYEMRVVKSGSMEPAIPTGSIVLVAPVESYEVGDVVTYHTGQAGSIPVTHRIVKKNQGEQHLYYLTKGDANEDMDPSPVAHQRVMGKVTAHLPFMGYAIEFARTPLGFALLIGIPALVIILDELANIAWEFHKYRFARRRQGKVGYRTPARDRRPRDVGRPHQKKQPTNERSTSFTPQSVIKKQAVAPERRRMVDMQRYELNRHSI